MQFYRVFLLRFVVLYLAFFSLVLLGDVQGASLREGLIINEGERADDGEFVVWVDRGYSKGMSRRIVAGYCGRVRDLLVPDSLQRMMVDYVYEKTATSDAVERRWCGGWLCRVYCLACVGCILLFAALSTVLGLYIYCLVSREEGEFCTSLFSHRFHNNTLR